MHTLLHSSRYHLLILFFLWICVQLFAYFHFGIGTGCDTDFYISIGENMHRGQIPQGREMYYASYGAIFASFHGLGLAYEYIVWLQLLCAGLSLYCLYQLAHDIFKSRAAAFLSCILYLTWVKIHQWNFFLYTESLYTSFSIIVVWLLLTRLSSPWSSVCFLLCLLWTFFLRPSSVCLLVGLVVYGLHYIYRTRPKLFWPSVLVLVSGGVCVFNHMLRHYELIESYLKAEVIYPNVRLWIPAPLKLATVQTSYPLWDLVMFIIHNPLYFTKLFTLKLALFYANTKPYFSWLHNGLIVLFLWPLYYWAIRTLHSLFKEKEIMVLGSIIIFQGLIVGLTTENWDGRFLIPVLPFVFVLAGGALVNREKTQESRHIDIRV